VARVGCSCELVAIAERQRPRNGSDWTPWKPERRARHVVRVVERAQLPQHRVGLVREPAAGRLGAPERRLREREPAQQVIPVRVGAEQAAEWELGLLEEVGQSS